MRKAAKVTSIDALQRFRANYAEFGELAHVALSGAESDILRMLGWLKEQGIQWRRQLRKREQKFNEARTELINAEMSSSDTRPSCFTERKAFEKAKRAVEEARWKIDRCKYWHKMIEREFMLFKGHLRPLSSRLDREIPRGLARLSQLMDHLDKYLRMSAPTTHKTRKPRASTETNDAISKDDTGPENNS